MPSFLHCAPLGKLYLSLACLLSLWNAVSAIKEEAKKEKLMTFLPTAASGNNEVQKEKDVAFLGATELPARSVDLSALNLTELVNSMLARALRDSRKFFSLLSITSYSSFAFHKFSVAIYNISNLKTVDPVKFPTRYCYCLNNRTNELSDFTALLVDIIGNSTSYLTEIFKSTSILSVSQTNESDCIFICVMTGKSGRNLSDFWEMAEKSPVINYTFTSSTSGVQTTRGAAMTSILPPTSWQTLRTSPLRGTPSTRVFSLKASSWPETAPSSAGLQTRLPEHNARTMAPRDTSPPVHPTLATRRVAGTLWVTVNQQPEASTLPVPWAPTTDEKTPGGPPWEASSSKPPGSPVAEEPMSTWVLSGSPARTVASPSSQPQASPTSGTQTPSPTKAPAPKYPHAGDLPAAWPFSRGEEPALVPWPHQVSRCPQPFPKEGAQTAAPPTLAFQKLNPCLMELCRFFQQCLCMAPKRVPGMEAVRYCLDYYSWFLKNATYICQRMKRVSWSYTLKQKCLENICKSV